MTATPKENPTKLPAERLVVYTVLNGWTLDIDFNTRWENGCVRQPGYVFNDPIDLAAAVLKAIVPDSDKLETAVLSEGDLDALKQAAFLSGVQSERDLVKQMNYTGGSDLMRARAELDESNKVRSELCQQVEALRQGQAVLRVARDESLRKLRMELNELRASRERLIAVNATHREENKKLLKQRDEAVDLCNACLSQRDVARTERDIAVKERDEANTSIHELALQRDIDLKRLTDECSQAWERGRRSGIDRVMAEARRITSRIVNSDNTPTRE